MTSPALTFYNDPMINEHNDNDIEDYDDIAECECELDWNCGCGRYGGFTYIETRYDMDPEEAY